MTPFIIAELSANHCKSLDIASDLVRAAADAGANAIKLQTFTPQSMVADENYIITDGTWKGLRLIDLYHDAHTPWDWHEYLFELAESLNIDAFSSVYDREGVDFLESIDCPMYKISSFEVPDLALIRYVASKGKPVIVSTGMATYGEIQAIMRIANEMRVKFTLMKCTSAYPATPSDANLITLQDMSRYFHCDMGLSDHTLGSATACVAMAMGATVFEKHLILDRTYPSPDRGFSSNPAEFKQYVRDIHDAYQAIGNIHYGPTNSEKPSHLLRRSLYFAHDIDEGVMLHRNDFRTARPAEGVPPEQLPLFMGRFTAFRVKAGQPVTWDVTRE